MKRVLIAAATAAVLATSALTGAASANAAETTATNLVQVHGPGQGQWNGGGKGNWNGGGHWNNRPDHWKGGKGYGGHWQGPPKWKARKSCDPIVRWRRVGPPWHQRWDRVIVGWDCDRHQKHWRQRW